SRTPARSSTGCWRRSSSHASGRRSGSSPAARFPARDWRHAEYPSPGREGIDRSTTSEEPMAVATEQQETTFQEMTDEQKAIVEMVRNFVDNEIIPNAEEYDHEDKFAEPIVEQMKELGLFGVTIPEDYGGMGLDLTTYAMIVEELSR